MYHLLMNLPIVGTLGFVALLAGPIANLSLASGAWVLEKCVDGGAIVVGKCLLTVRNTRA